MTDSNLMQQALDALKYASDQTKPENLHGCDCLICTTILALRDRLAQPEQEPVAWYHADNYKTHFTTEPSSDLIGKYWQPLYTTPPQRKPLTDEEILDATCHLGGWNIDVARCVINHARAIEAAHGIKS